MKRENFRLDWLFAVRDDGGMEPPLATAFAPVDLPHDWQIRHADDLYRDGTGFYRKYLFCQLEPGKRWMLWFGAAYMDTTLFVNGKQAGQWKNGYTSFWFDITDYLHNGQNEILVRCSLLHPNSRWYSGAGLFREVELWQTPSVHLVPNGLYVASKEQPDGSWQVNVSAEIGSAGSGAPDWQSKELTVRIAALDGSCAAELSVPFARWEQISADDAWRTGCETEIYRASCSFTLQNPKLWSLETPNLYHAQAVLRSAGQETDSDETRFGCRTFEVTPDKGLFINHQHVQIKGVCMHHDLGGLGSAFEYSAAKRQMEILKSMGANSIRTGHTAPAPELMDLADEMGILIDDESFDCWRKGKTEYDYGRFFDDWQAKDVAAWVRRDRNHPSLLFWSIGNEIYDTHAGPEGADTLRLLMQEVAQHDPAGNGIQTFGSNYMPWPNTQACADIIKVAGYNYGERLYNDHHKKHPDWVIYGSETASVVQSRGIYHFPLAQSLLADDDLQCSSLGNSRTSWGAESLDICLLSERKYPYTLGQYLWTGFDYIGEPTPSHTRNSYFGMIDTAGFAKDAYYVCQAAWLDPKTQPMVHLFPYWDFNENQKIDLCACTNAHSVELWVNGESLGRQVIDPDKGRTATWQAPYKPGRVYVAAYDENGNKVAEDEQCSFGESAGISLQADRTELSGDGRELAFITITVHVAIGNPVRNANDRVSVRINGAGVLVALDNGDSADPDEYQTTSRRLFSGQLLAVVAGCGRTGVMTVEVSAPGLRSAALTLKANAFAGAARRRLPPIPPKADPCEVPVRKLELTADRTEMDKDHPVARITALRHPVTANYRDIEWQLTDDRGVPAVNASMQQNGDILLVQALGDGPLRVRALVRNGREAPQLISTLELNITGMGQLHKNPYEFISASRYDASFGEIGNGNERGVSTSRTGKSWILFRDIDFGPDGADTVEMPIFSLDGEPTVFRFWDGEPYAEGSTMIGERIYHKPKQWNVYQPDTFKLDKLLRGCAEFAVELSVKVHIKGFCFAKHSRAWDTLPAASCDSVYGDTFTRSGSQILGIGNNVSLVFDRMDFGTKGCTGIRVRGRSSLPANTVHLLFASTDGSAEPERRVVEFGPQPDWGEQSFTFEPVTGARQVTFLFLPGTQFDFDSFTFV